MPTYSFITISTPHGGNSNNEAVTSKNLLPRSILGTLFDIKVVAKYEAHAKTFLYFMMDLVRGHTTS